ncbi:hypothetical protein MUB23_18860 [Cuneatibacter sp. NSJ-177]|uniref:hypothetical protein n=1 Tax=Cuneatibacter sp. NSJ-177 TaxID=2931401 RepID=UPI001FD37E12|nr:hypothetical protein [Cuneatibacter sp. NSJ-177]MCJ7837443.1 hypothetical protein [Cuneatibacter sp. NSJ-177]
MFEWRIRESDHGGFVAEYGGPVQSGIEAGFKPGFYMPAFIVYESAHFDNEAEAQRYLARSKTSPQD